MANRGITVVFILSIILASCACADDATDEAAAKITGPICKLICLAEMGVGGIAALMIILAGLRYVTAGDDAGVRRKVWGWIINAFVGVAIVAVAVYIVNYVASEISAPLNCNCEGERYLAAVTQTPVPGQNMKEGYNCTGPGCPCKENPEKLCCADGKLRKDPEKYNQLCQVKIAVTDGSLLKLTDEKGNVKKYLVALDVENKGETKGSGSNIHTYFDSAGKQIDLCDAPVKPLKAREVSWISCESEASAVTEAVNNAILNSASMLYLVARTEYGPEYRRRIPVKSLEPKLKVQGASDGCYEFNGLKPAKTPIGYIINPTNSQGVPESLIVEAIKKAAETWDKEVSIDLFGENPEVSYTAVPELNSVESKSLVLFGKTTDTLSAQALVASDAETGVIYSFAIAINENIGEWGDAEKDNTKNDIQDVMTHEFGHIAGLNEVQGDACSEATMYQGIETGQTRRRTLEQADIDGLREVYGS